MADHGPVNWDIPHRFVASYIYDLPFFTTSSRPLLKVRCGWMADRERDNDPERVDHQRDDRRRHATNAVGREGDVLK